VSDRWCHIEDLFHRALEREEGDRAAFLREACAGDESLRVEVETLLKQVFGQVTSAKDQNHAVRFDICLLN
jgi:hypothetical protein